MPAKETVKFRAKTPKGRFGDPAGAVPAWRPVPGCTVVPRTATDDEQRGPIVIGGFMIKAPPNTPILDTDEVEVRGEVHTIDGTVADFKKKGKLLYVQRVN